MAEQFLSKIANASKVAEVVEACSIAVFALGATRCSYHLIPPFSDPVGSGVKMLQKGYPTEFLARFVDFTFRDDDPITRWIFQHGRTISWKTAVAGRQLTPGQQSFVAFSHTLGLFDGIGIPLFGPDGNNGYATVSLGDRDIIDEDEPLCRELTAIWEAGHRQIFQLVVDSRPMPKLAARESEILMWVSKSKSNTDIATILGLSPATVDTVIRRIFAKLGVNDRLAAVVCGLRNGLIKY